MAVLITQAIPPLLGRSSFIENYLFLIHLAALPSLVSFISRISLSLTCLTYGLFLRYNEFNQFFKKGSFYLYELRLS